MFLKPKHNGLFSFAELLVVIAIIAILLGILLPVLKKAKDMAKSSICIANFKQLGLGFALCEDFEQPERHHQWDMGQRIDRVQP